ncbi:hypothetical protein E3O45_14325 [Cryobacterium sp. TMS1-20-1]|uniref:hypothetical protein n=1 Tax=Cryobacterium sp. TMS1-20-1 TaxID=1259223 RepID=UPI0010699666|nr:hypothetical protein [Cryobacterium sp. TMS1-20-1]TFC71822.1 hypothetical protein E3O45_14325 [Cryobacterium sp. TMS1-20-1]
MLNENLTAESLLASARLSAVWNETIASPTVLAFSDWSLTLRGEEIADITYRGVPVLRGLRVVVRDENWGTPIAVVTSTQIEPAPSALLVSLAVSHRDGNVDFGWQGLLKISADTLRFSFVGTAAQSFLSNRIGIVVLHPPTLAGQVVTVTNPSGAETAVRFSRTISPHQPARNIAGIRWNVAGFTASLGFIGDIFETEDQRNWTDASFKTYSTPLDRPFPVQISPGTPIEQSVVLRIAESPSPGGERATAPTEIAAAFPPDQRTRIVVGGPSNRIVPEITLGASSAPGVTPDRAGLAAILVELNMADTAWPDVLARAQTDADGHFLDVRIVASTAAQVNCALDAVAPLDVRRLGVFDAATHLSEPLLWAALIQGAAERDLRAKLVGGTRAHFTELNRNHDQLPSSVTALAFSVTPHMHALEREQLVESIAVQRTVAENAVRIARGRPLHIGPITLRPRFNAVATTAPAAGPDKIEFTGYGPEHLPEVTDARQQSAALAAWLIASVDAFAVPGVASLCYFEAWGARGIGGSGVAAQYPVATAVEWMRELEGESLRELRGDLPPAVAVLVADNRNAPGALTAVIANLADRTQKLTLQIVDCELRPGDDLGLTPGVLERVVIPHDATASIALLSPAISSETVPCVDGCVTVSVQAGEAVRWRATTGS